MGKVKAKSTTTTGSNVPVYQFPIGKVKVGRRLKRCARSLYVSIPYGKGKVVFGRVSMMMIIKYQFPMGKVKRKKQFNCNDNSLVSIPYGKGKVKNKRA